MAAVARRRSTSYDVAERAGVSQSAVSRCFTPGASISPALRERIMVVARDLGYRPNAIARGLITKHNNLIAVLITAAGNLYYPQLLFELSNRLSERGMRVLLFAVEAEDKVSDILPEVFAYQVDGVISVTRLSDAQIAEFEDNGTPVVLYNRLPANHPVSAVICDHEACGRMMASALLDAGHRQFGIIRGADFAQVVAQRVDGIASCLAGAGITGVATADGFSTYEGGAKALDAILRTNPNVTSIIAGNDIMAIGAIDHARMSLKLEIPRQISITGFDGIPQGRLNAYDLCTISQPVNHMAEAAVTILAERLVNQSLPAERRVFEGQFIVGGSALIGK
jgi:DNA-binding LacI/PurR family transcriptional regulator